MRTLEVISGVLILAVAVCGQYQYPKPPPPPPPSQSTPKNIYLPPSTYQPYVTPSTFKYEKESNIGADSLKPDAEHEPGMPFDFTYAVKDDTGNDFSHNAESNGDVVKGMYKTLLPDGRLQVVKYTADWKNGYNAEVTYEGEAKIVPEPPRTTKRPKNPYENEEIIDSQFLTPPPRKTPKPYIPPPTTQRYVPPTQKPYVPSPTTQRYVPPTTQRYVPPTTQRYVPPTTQRYVPPTTQRYVPPTTQRYVPPTTQRYVPPTTQRYVPPPTTRAPYIPVRTTQPPIEPPGLYGAPSLPFGVRNNPKFGYSRK